MCDLYVLAGCGLHLSAILPFRSSAVAGCSSACLSAAPRCRLPALPSLFLVCDVGGGAGTAFLWCVGDVAMGDVGPAVFCCFAGSSLCCPLGTLPVAGIVTGVARVGVGSADAGFFHGPASAHTAHWQPCCKSQ